MLLDVARAEQAVSFILNRAKQIKTVCGEGWGYLGGLQHWIEKFQCPS